MIFGAPNIVVVDNEKEELERIRDAFFGAGIPCLPIKYESDDPDNESGIDHVDLSENLAPRVIVSDLNLAAMQNAKPINLVAPLANVVKKLSVAGPYLLCIWSKHESDAEEVIRLLEERYGEDVALPIQWTVISKTEFLHGGEELQGKVKKLISESSLFEAALRWESRVSEAARNTTNALFELAKEVDDTGSINGSSEQMRKILAEVGNESLGHLNARETPAMAIEYGLAPILEDQLYILPSQDLDLVWKTALPDIGKKGSIDSSVKSQLNAFYHVATVPESFEKDGRGVFVALDMEFVGKAPNKFKRKLGRKPSSIINEEFIYSDGSQEGKEVRDQARQEIVLGFMEISPACDHAQKKIKLPKFVIGALIPEKFEDLTYFKSKTEDGLDISRPSSHEGIYRFPKIKIGGEAYILKLSFKYQIGSQPSDNKWFGNPMFRIREQILSAVTQSCSQYASRSGIVSFW